MNLEHNRRKCGGCDESDPAIIHTVSERGVSRRFCTDCLLRNSKQLFCPVCLYLFDEVPPPNARLMCLNCPSITHLSCSPPSLDTSAATGAASAPVSSSSACFTCPPCSDPNFSFFPKSQSDNNNGEKDGSETTLDVASIKALVAAANIAAISMTKAASMAKMEADKKVQEAILAKKRAKEALEHVQYLVNKKIKSGNSNKKKTSDI